MTAASSRRTGSSTAGGVRFGHNQSRPAASDSQKNFFPGVFRRLGAGGRRGAGAGGSPPGPAAGLEECQDSARPAAAAGDRDPRRWPAWISLPVLEGPSRGKGPPSSWRLRIALALCVRGSRPRRSRVLLLSRIFPADFFPPCVRGVVAPGDFRGRSCRRGVGGVHCGHNDG